MHSRRAVFFTLPNYRLYHDASTVGHETADLASRDALSRLSEVLPSVAACNHIMWTFAAAPQRSFRTLLQTLESALEQSADSTRRPT